MISAVLSAGLLLSGCDGDTLSQGAKANKPIPEKLLAEMDAKNMDKGSPMLVRLFKQEAELEVWKQDRSGQFALLKTYPICRWSGDIGPKVREGDRQAPEGFYAITPRQMNPASAYYLSFNIGYPNAYDKSWGRTGSELMVHGDCSSRGCYAMTDEQISEIYSLGRESFFGGQNAFQVQAYPFRLTAQNMAKYRDNPNMPFWRMIKEGNDIFEATKTEPKVDVCERKYVFDAEPPPGGRPLSFNPTGKCPAYQMNPEVAQALQQKQREDNSKLAELISRGTPLAKSRAGIDGGMHPVFANKLPDAPSIAMADVNDYTVPPTGPAPGTIPAYVNPPKAPESSVFDAVPASPTTDSSDPKMTSAPQTADNSSSGGGFFSSLAKKVGLAKDEPDQAAASAAKPAATPKSKPVPKTVQTAKASDSKAAAPRVISLDRTAQAQSPFPPVAPAQPQQPTPPQSIAGAAPAPPSNSFNSRWSTMQ
jgi:murein L,D-transpeptidase YafK